MANFEEFCWNFLSSTKSEIGRSTSKGKLRKPPLISQRDKIRVRMGEKNQTYGFEIQHCANLNILPNSYFLEMSTKNYHAKKFKNL